MGQYSVLIFCIPTVFDIIPLELVRFRNFWYSVSSGSFSCPALPLSFSFSYSKCRSRKRLRGFSTVSDHFHPYVYRPSMRRWYWHCYKSFTIDWPLSNRYNDRRSNAYYINLKQHTLWRYIFIAINYLTQGIWKINYIFSFVYKLTIHSVLTMSNQYKLMKHV